MCIRDRIYTGKEDTHGTHAAGTIAATRKGTGIAGIADNQYVKMCIRDRKRDVLADPLYNNKVVTKLINNIMLDGKKGVAQKIVYGAFNRVEEKSGKPALEVFEEAMNNIMPVLEVKAKRIGVLSVFHNRHAIRVTTGQQDVEAVLLGAQKGRMGFEV